MIGHLVRAVNDNQSLIDGPDPLCYAGCAQAATPPGFGTARGVVLCDLFKGCKQRYLAEPGGP
jgi:hypothetical protein